MLYLFLLMVIGYFLAKKSLVPSDASRTLSKLENYLFIPALVLKTFMDGFTKERLFGSGKILLVSCIIVGISITIAHILSRIIYPDSEYIRKIAIYGLSFANFGYMGNAIVMSVFPELFVDYLIFTIPPHIMVYMWAVPILLIPKAEEECKNHSISSSFKALFNPMFVAMLIGMVLGITGVAKYIPTGIRSVISISADCMSPIAMLLTGMTLASSSILTLLKNKRTYLLSAIRLVAIPCVFILAVWLLPLTELCGKGILTLAICAIAMPLGLNTIVIPGGYGKDTTDAAGMALISHALSCITIPLIFLLFNVVV